ncbi:hypothetical protein ACCO45_000564 [Purpureocillium lilacinum]|uniref:Uncharacterized protein n=1 Tax=Purpureocillium lilacinum TaxID=33203 RepID=A0ACC4E7B8_PURLI
MFTQPVYLRNYTHNHLLSRDSSGSNSNSHSNSHAAPAGASNTSHARSGSGHGHGHSHGHGTASGANLTRSVSYTPSSTTTTPSSHAAAALNPTAPAAQNLNRLTLVSSNPDTSSAHARIASTTSHPESIPEAAAAAAAAAAAPATPHAADDRQPAMPHNATATSTPATGDAAAATASNPESTPSIRFSATLPNGTEVIRVGRYSERDGQAANMAGNQPSAAPVGFKSKVVSRRHCEFWCEDGKWYIRDVKSSSGTFLNHIRLSPPSQESKAYPVNDGDIVQLGIDFKGGEEMIFRCVKMRLELNRGWQNKLNTFNVAAHKRLRTMATGNGAASVSSSNSQDCSICLNSIAPCQSLFVAPCSHTWHFKCVRSLLSSPQYPIFVCPNCRAGADLEADVEEPDEEWQQLEEGADDEAKPQTANGQPPEAVLQPSPVPAPEPEPDAMDITMDVTVNPNASDSPSGRSNLPHEPTEPVPIRNPASGAGRVNQLRENRSPSPHTNGEGPITPRNNAGPWVFDGGAGRRVADPTAEMTSLDAATEMDLSGGGTSDASSR